MRRRDMLKSAGAAAVLATAGLPCPAIGQSRADVLRFVPQADLTSLDTVWATSATAAYASYMIFDTLYGIDDSLTSRPQMCAGHEISSDELTWTFTLRDGLSFHDNEPVRAVDCTASLTRWWLKNPFGQYLSSLTNEVRPLDDKRFQIRLKQPFRQMLYALGAGVCFMMPERVAKTPAAEQIKEYVGSGPFRFLQDEWVSGSHAAWAKNEKYMPRQEPPQYFAGGKVVHVDRVEWITQPDPGTAAAALQTGEVDWVELPLIDLLPKLKGSPGVEVATFDPLGWLGVLAFNHLNPPFDNPKLLRALLPAVDQKEYVQSLVGEQLDLAKYPVGFFTIGTPMANTAGLSALSEPRDLAKAKQLVKDSGYKGEKIVLMSPTDIHNLQQEALVTRNLFEQLGLNVDYQAMDWGTLANRRFNQGPPDKGGWSAFTTIWPGLTMSNPGSSYPLRANGKKSWFGWLTDDRLEALRVDWFNAPDLAAQKKICEQIQLRAFETVPFMPLGQIFQPTAFRSNLTGFVKCGYFLFWGVQKS